MGGRGIGKGDERDQSVLYICMTLSKNRLIKNFNRFPFLKKMILITLMIFFFFEEQQYLKAVLSLNWYLFMI